MFTVTNEKQVADNAEYELVLTGLLTRQYLQYCANLICNNSLKDRFNSDMFRWNIYRYHQGNISD
jgi:hypothetical protein